MSFIYSILNKVNGKIYVGQTITGKKRFTDHKYGLNKGIHPNNHLQSSWDKYGEDSFEFNVLEYCDESKLNDNEIWWINYFNSTNPDNGYNLQSGGKSNYKVSDETCKKLSELNKGENHWNYGKHHPISVRNKISKSMKSIVNPMYKDGVSEKVSKTRMLKYSSTGYYRVSKHKKSDCKQGFYWRYQWREDGKRKSINSVDFDKLREKVISKGLLWCKISELDEVLF